MAAQGPWLPWGELAGLLGLVSIVALLSAYLGSLTFHRLRSKPRAHQPAAFPQAPTKTDTNEQLALSQGPSSAAEPQQDPAVTKNEPQAQAEGAESPVQQGTAIRDLLEAANRALQAADEAQDRLEIPEHEQSASGYEGPGRTPRASHTPLVVGVGISEDSTSNTSLQSLSSLPRRHQDVESVTGASSVQPDAVSNAAAQAVGSFGRWLFAEAEAWLCCRQASQQSSGPAWSPDRWRRARQIYRTLERTVRRCASCCQKAAGADISRSCKATARVLMSTG